VIDAPSLAEDMACRFPKSLVIQGSGSDGHALQDARASQADMLFAVDEDDSRNMVACLIAKQRFSIKHVVALASACEDKPAFSALEIVSICAPDVVVDALVGDLQVG
jgi:Trk K+ transport system NAD-binding subunit